MNKALFLDRDGIINIDHGYVYQIADFEFTDGIFDLCRYAADMGYMIFVITNQGGIARGYYTEKDVETLHMWMKEKFISEGVNIAQIYYCPHYETGEVKPYNVICDCRKPSPGMIFAAQKDHSLDLGHSIFIGDKTSDIQAADKAGIHNRILVASKYEDDKHINAHRVENIKQAIPFIA